MKYIDVVKGKLMRIAKLFFTSDEEFESALKHSKGLFDYEKKKKKKNHKENNWKKFSVKNSFMASLFKKKKKT